MDICGKRYRIKSRTRFILFITISVIFSVVLLNTVMGFYNASSLTVQDYMTIEIQSGDTLWDLADQYMPDSMDVRHAVYKICLINDISADEIYPGELIQIPIYE